MLKSLLHSKISSLDMCDDNQVSVKTTISALHVSIRDDRLSRLLTTLRTFEKTKDMSEIGRPCFAFDSYAVWDPGVVLFLLSDCTRPISSESFIATSISHTVSQEGIYV